MTTQVPGGYVFERLPIEPIAAGTNVLISGPALGGTSGVLFDVLGDAGEDEGMLLISADMNGAAAIEEYEAAGRAFDPGRMCVVDCVEHSQEAPNVPVRRVASPSDLTGVGMEFSSLYQSLHGSGLTQVRIGLHSISTLLVYADDFRPVYRFLHTVTSRIRTADGLGAFTIDPDAVEDKALATIAQAFDAKIEVREVSGTLELRIQGLEGQPDGWQAIER